MTITTLNTIIEEKKKEFEEMERNHGWIPEHKERIQDFITTAMQRAYEAGRQNTVTKLRERILDDAFFDVCDGCSCDAKEVIKQHCTLFLGDTTTRQ